jgi:hypothetical protein
MGGGKHSVVFGKHRPHTAVTYRKVTYRREREEDWSYTCHDPCR